MRFLSGHQLDLFTGLTPHTTVAVEGTVSAPENTVSLAASSGSPETPHQSTPHATLDTLSVAGDASPQAILQREARTHRAISDQDIFDNGAASQNGAHGMYADRTPPQTDRARPIRVPQQPAPQRTNAPSADRGILHGRRGLSPLRRHEEHVRHGRRAELRNVRRHHDALRLLLPLYELRQHLRLQLEEVLN